VRPRAPAGRRGAEIKNQPPRTAFPHLPGRPSIPLFVDPDHWLKAIDGQAYVRRVRSSGDVSVDREHYYIGNRLVNQAVALVVESASGEFRVLLHGQEIKRLAMHGIVGHLLSFDAFVAVLCQQAHEDHPRQFEPSA
jgi:hypothetical protein